MVKEFTPLTKRNIRNAIADAILKYGLEGDIIKASSELVREWKYTHGNLSFEDDSDSYCKMARYVIGKFARRLVTDEIVDLVNAAIDHHPIVEVSDKSGNPSPFSPSTKYIIPFIQANAALSDKPKEELFPYVGDMRSFDIKHIITDCKEMSVDVTLSQEYIIWILENGTTCITKTYIYDISDYEHPELPAFIYKIHERIPDDVFSKQFIMEKLLAKVDWKDRTETLVNKGFFSTSDFYLYNSDTEVPYDIQGEIAAAKEDPTSPPDKSEDDIIPFSEDDMGDCDYETDDDWYFEEREYEDDDGDSGLFSED